MCAPTDAPLDLIVNAVLPSENRFVIGKLRMTECRLPLTDKPLPDVDVAVSVADFKGTRTALVGKTRLGKSNVWRAAGALARLDAAAVAGGLAGPPATGAVHAGA